MKDVRVRTTKKETRCNKRDEGKTVPRVLYVLDLRSLAARISKNENENVETELSDVKNNGAWRERDGTRSLASYLSLFGWGFCSGDSLIRREIF